jgi:hypothetical protein
LLGAYYADALADVCCQYHSTLFPGFLGTAPNQRHQIREITEKLARNIRQNSLLNFSITIISTTYDENKKFFYGARSKWEKSGKFAASLVPSAARPANKEPNI